MSVCPLVGTWAIDIKMAPDAADPDTALHNKLCWHYTMSSGDRAGNSQQAIPLHSHISSSTSLHNAEIVLLLFSISLTNTYTVQ